MTYLITTKTYEKIIVAEWVNEFTNYDEHFGITKYIKYLDTFGNEKRIDSVVKVEIINKHNMSDTAIGIYWRNRDIKDLSFTQDKIYAICNILNDVIDEIDVHLENKHADRLEEIELELRGILKEIDSEIEKRENDDNY